VSSSSMSPCNGSRVALTIARRSLCSSSHTAGEPAGAGAAAPRSLACRSSSNRPPKTRPSTGAWSDAGPCLRSGTLDNDTWHTRDAANRRAETLARDHSVDTETPQAIDRPRDTVGRPPRPRTVAETRGGLSGTTAAAPRYATVVTVKSLPFLEPMELALGLSGQRQASAAVLTNPRHRRLQAGVRPNADRKFLKYYTLGT
jgi:hypothetical protein